MKIITYVFTGALFLLNFFVFDHYLDEAWDKVGEYQQQVFDLQDELRAVHSHKPTYTVTATMYRPTRYETDSSPNITADGTRINISNAGSYRYIAVSRDMLSRWGGPFDYGDYVVIEGTQEHDGIWQIKDTMNPRFTERIDFLCDLDAKPFKYDNVMLTGI